MNSIAVNAAALLLPGVALAFSGVLY